MPDPAAEHAFQDEIIAHLTDHGWLLGSSDQYDREWAIYPEDVVGSFKDTQPDAWKRIWANHPQEPEEALLRKVTEQLEKVDPPASTVEMRKYGTLGVLRHIFKDRGVPIKLCQFKPDHGLNPDTLAAYTANRLRVVPELWYSPYTRYPAKGEKPRAAGRAWRIDLVLFINGIPVATLELKKRVQASGAEHGEAVLPRPAAQRPGDGQAGAIAHLQARGARPLRRQPI